MTTSTLVSLIEAPLSRSLKVHSIQGGDDFVHRFYELGILPGSEIRIQQRAPFNGPIYLSCPNFCFFIRSHVARLILCEGV